jgi:hypothetical protein
MQNSAGKTVKVTLMKILCSILTACMVSSLLFINPLSFIQKNNSDKQNSGLSNIAISNKLAYAEEDAATVERKNEALVKKTLGIAELKVNFTNANKRTIFLEQKNIVNQLKRLSENNQKSELKTIAIRQSKVMRSVIKNRQKKTEKELLAKKTSALTKLTSAQKKDAVEGLQVSTNVPVKTYQLDSDTTVTFDGAVVKMEDFNVSQETVASSADEAALEGTTDSNQKVAYASGAKTKYANWYVEYVDIVGLAMAGMYLYGKFTYNGKKVIAYRREPQSCVQVYGPEVVWAYWDGLQCNTKVSSGSTATLYYSGYIKRAIGNWVLTNAYTWVTLSCTKKGKITHDAYGVQ